MYSDPILIIDLCSRKLTLKGVMYVGLIRRWNCDEIRRHVCNDISCRMFFVLWCISNPCSLIQIDFIRFNAILWICVLLLDLGTGWGLGAGRLYTLTIQRALMLRAWRQAMARRADACFKKGICYWLEGKMVHPT